jgi:hypothetical protein
MFTCLGDGTTSSALVATTVCCASAYLAFRLFEVVRSRISSPLRDLPGPPNPSYLLGHIKQFQNADVLALQEDWVRQYGSSFISQAPLMVRGPSLLSTHAYLV